MPSIPMSPEQQNQLAGLSEQEIQRLLAQKQQALAGLTQPKANPPASQLMAYNGPGGVSKDYLGAPPSPAYQGAGAYSGDYLEPTRVGDTSQGPFGSMRTTQVYDRNNVPPAMQSALAALNTGRSVNLGDAQQQALGMSPQRGDAAPQGALAQALNNGPPPGDPSGVLGLWKQLSPGGAHGINNPDLLPMAMGVAELGSKHQIGMTTAEAHKMAAQAEMAKATGEDDKQALQELRQLVLQASANEAKGGPAMKDSLPNLIAAVKATNPNSRKVQTAVDSLMAGFNPSSVPGQPPPPIAPSAQNPLAQPTLPQQTMDQFMGGLGDSLDRSALGKQLRLFGDSIKAFPQGTAQIQDALAQRYKLPPDELKNRLMDLAMGGMMLGSPTSGDTNFSFGGAKLSPDHGSYSLTLPNGVSRTVAPRGLSAFTGLGTSLPMISRMNPLRTDTERQRILNEEVSPLLQLLSGSR